MRVFTAQYMMHVPRDPDVLVEKLFDNARTVLRKVANHRPTLITFFESGSDYVAHYHVLVPEPGDVEIPSVKPIIDKESPDAFAMISLSEVKVTSRGEKKHPEGSALFMVFHSNVADRMRYQTYRVVGKTKKGKPIIKMGESFTTDKSIDLIGFGNLAQARMKKPSYLG